MTDPTRQNGFRLIRDAVWAVTLVVALASVVVLALYLLVRWWT